MTTITKERLLKIQHWRETYGADSNVMLPAEEAAELARIALASLEAEKGADPVVFTDERNLRHIASGRETSLIWGKQNQEVGDIPLYRHAQPVPVDKEFIPKNLDKALGVVGVALPESKEEFNFQIERWIQRLIDRVIRYADEFKEQPAPVVPDERAAFNAWNNEDNLPIAGVGAKNAAWLAWQARASLCGNSALNVPPERPADSSNGDDVEAWFDEGWNACRTAMLNGGKS
ncbi:RNA methyltransferase [Salmonella enterica]|nr:Eaa protein [Salmonella enterica]ECS6876169.1 Eaa protein [Salmonella enterica subsp. enterica serovar Richmond]EAQ4571997.1 RNA methyltransferase [Salmonella enterica]EBC3087646.1 RNA methyltransferase [Salmonella enterica]EBD5591311.1 RNA methyltransferase [Salmonella enterica]